jgi:hypothetical protein
VPRNDVCNQGLLGLIEDSKKFDFQGFLCNIQAKLVEKSATSSSLQKKTQMEKIMSAYAMVRVSTRYVLITQLECLHAAFIFGREINLETAPSLKKVV